MRRQQQVLEQENKMCLHPLKDSPLCKYVIFCPADCWASCALIYGHMWPVDRPNGAQMGHSCGRHGDNMFDDVTKCSIMVEWCAVDSRVDRVRAA